MLLRALDESTGDANSNKKAAKKERQRARSRGEQQRTDCSHDHQPTLHEAEPECVQRHTDRDCGQREGKKVGRSDDTE